MKVYFIGAGPGDPELITVKGMKIIQKADVIIYAGSLVNREVLTWARPDAEIHNSATMDFEEITGLMLTRVREGKTVARVHTGDPSLYGALQEQIDFLRRHGVEFEIVPGVSSFLAAAASLQQEYTLPGVTQTVILTRLEGRTPVPEREKLSSLAAHGCTMCIFLSVQDIERVVEELLRGGYTAETPVAVVQKASWPEEKKVIGTLADIAARVKEAGINRTALIIVGEVFRGVYERSRLYDPSFSHGYRQGREEN